MCQEVVKGRASLGSAAAIIVPLGVAIYFKFTLREN